MAPLLTGSFSGGKTNDGGCELSADAWLSVRVCPRAGRNEPGGSSGETKGSLDS